MMDARVFLAGFALFGAAVAHADATALERAIGESKPILDLRLRSESVEQEGFAADAEAFTLRARIGFETGKLMETRLLAEAGLMLPLNSRYNDTINRKARYPIVADPENYALNRLQLTNTSLPGTTVELGRQRWVLDDQRFVGNVGWRQSEQTFDALKVSNRSIRNWTFDVAYVDQVNRVFGADSPVGRYRGANYLLNASYQTLIGKITGFGYLLKFDRAPADSSQTVGVRFNGERAIEPLKIAYAASIARQRGSAGNPIDYRDNYYELELAASVRQLTLTAGIEVLQGDGVKGFATPLATLHKFQGWADKFLTTPVNGINDRYLAVGYSRKNLGPFDEASVQASQHWFRSERLAISYGDEWDLQLLGKRGPWTATFKVADYTARSLSTDTRKIFLQLEYSR